MRAKRDFRQESKINWRLYKKESGNKKLTYLDYVKIIQGFNMGVRDYLLETGKPVTLDYGLGTLVINRKRPNRYKTIHFSDGNSKEVVSMYIDWQESKRCGKHIYKLNEHTDGYKFHIKWFRQSSKIKYKQYWKFNAYRDFSRLLKHYLTMPQYRDTYGEWGSII